MNQSNTSMASDLSGFRREVQEHAAQGRLEEAIELCLSVQRDAEDAGDQDLADRAFCTRAGLSILRGEGRTDIPALQKVLMRSANVQNRFNAAYQVSHFHYLNGDSQKSLFYARQALRYAEEFGEKEALLCAHNAIGNQLVLDSYFEEAEGSYRRALQFHESGDSMGRAVLLANIGYCEVVTGSLGAGYRSLTDSLRMMRRLGSESWQHLPHLGLSYACLEVGRYERARRHAERAYRLAEGAQVSGGVKNALYLLGESEKLCGFSGQAYEHFHELQSRFYPNNPMVIEVLMAADVRKMINLMA